MKRILLLMAFMAMAFQGFSQTKGISYQAVILNPNPQEIPGANAQGNILANSAVSIEFSIINSSGTEEYQEKHSTRTDRYGMINLLIGNGTPTGSKDFTDIKWLGTTKKLKVAIDFTGGNNFSPLSEQNLSYMPQPPTEETTQLILDNTAAISAETARAKFAEQTNAAAIALNTAKTGITSAQASAIVANTAKVSYTDALVSANTAVAANTAKVGITSAQATTISNITGVNTGDQDLSGLATTTALNLKANIASPTFTGTPTAPTAVAGISTTQIATTEFVGIAITDKFVDLTTDQTIAGIKTFSVDADVNGLTVGRGKFNENSNTAIGNAALATNAGYANTALGRAALELNTSGNGNTANGYTALAVNTEGNENTAIGRSSLFNNTIGNNNTALGYNSGIGNTTGSGNTFLGTYATVSDGAFSNATAIGYQANATTNNTIQLGNTDVTDVITSGTITAGEVKYPNTKGTNGQVLTSAGNGTATWTTPSSANNGSSLQLVSTSERDDLGLATSGYLVLNTTTNTFQGSKAILPPYDYYTTTIYGFSMIIPGYSLTQTFTAGGQTISSAKIATVNMGSGWASNSGSFTFAIHDDVNNYDLFSTTITISGAGDIIVPISGYDWSSGYPPVSGPLKLPVGTCSFVITSSSNGGGSANFLLNASSGVGVLTNTYWESRGGTSAGYTNPNTNNPLSIALYPSAQSGIIWVDLSK